MTKSVGKIKTLLIIAIFTGLALPVLVFAQSDAHKKIGSISKTKMLSCITPTGEVVQETLAKKKTKRKILSDRELRKLTQRIERQIKRLERQKKKKKVRILSNSLEGLRNLLQGLKECRANVEETSVAGDGPYEATKTISENTGSIQCDVNIKVVQGLPLSEGPVVLSLLDSDVRCTLAKKRTSGTVLLQSENVTLLSIDLSTVTIRRKSFSVDVCGIEPACGLASSLKSAIDSGTLKVSLQ